MSNKNNYSNRTENSGNCKDMDQQDCRRSNSQNSSKNSSRNNAKSNAQNSYRNNNCD